MEKENFATSLSDLPILLTAQDIQSIGFSRTMAYQILNRTDAPVIKIGDRKFIKRDEFFNWLDNQNNNKMV